MKPSTPSRKVLHITYCVEPEQPRHIKIPLHGVRIAAICAAAAGIATFSCLLWLFSPTTPDSNSLAWLEQIAASINYSPEGNATLAAAAGARAGINSAHSSEASAASRANLPSAGPIAARPLATVESTVINNTISIKSPEFEYDADGLHASFAVVNNGPNTAHGTVWGTANFETDAGEIISVGSHSQLDLSAFDDMRHIEQGTPFKAKNLTTKSLVFRFPRNKTGRFTEVRLAAGERIRAQLIVATFALDRP